MLKDMTIAQFGEVLASNSPAPGGGSVAALSGMLGANLVSMVCRLTIGKQGYEAHSDEVSEVLQQSEALSQSLLRRIDLDTEAFNEVMAAFKLPKADDEQKAARTAAIQGGYKSAIQSPLGIARECVAVLQLASRLPGNTIPRHHPQLSETQVYLVCHSITLGGAHCHARSPKSGLKHR